jgi:hypothetical protein
MMGHREKMKGGDEYDAFTGWRRFLRFRPGERKKTKHSFWKRIRASLRSAPKEDEE